jgi:hypothetical protein
VCTACCYRLDSADPDPTPDLVVVIPPAAPPAPEVEPQPTAPEARDALHHWPFGAADEDTGRAVREEQSHELREQIGQASAAAGPQPAPPSGNGLGIPTQRHSAFNPMQVATSPPPNPYLAAERRQQAGFRSAADIEESRTAPA